MSTAASVIGLIGGGWNIFAYFGACHSSGSCLQQTSAPADPLGLVYAGFSAALIVASVGGLVGPKVIFYAMATLAGLIDLVEVIGRSNVATDDLIMTFVLASLGIMLSLLAATSGMGMSEQSNPMNLPVFG